MIILSNYTIYIELDHMELIKCEKVILIYSTWLAPDVKASYL